MITDDQAEKDLNELASTDDRAAELKVNVERQAYMLKRTEAAHFMTASGNIEERKAAARNSDDFKQREEEYLKAYLDSEKMNNHRKTLALRLDVYRTQCANRRQG